MTKTELFLELSHPDEYGVSRWVSVTEFPGRYASLAFGNGASRARKESRLAKKYAVEFDKTVTPGNGIDKIRLNGINSNPLGIQNIRSDIRRVIKSRRCVVLGTSNPEADHKNGWKNDHSTKSIQQQRLSDFQPLSKAANDAKRQFCKECRNTRIRYDARLLGYPVSYYAGGKIHDGSSSGCTGCFWYDPVEFRKHLISI